jgi:broad specificity phosphatase PhoE
MRLAWDEKRPATIYLIRHGERWDYTDIEWAKQSDYPHDSPLSKVGEKQAS